MKPQEILDELIDYYSLKQLVKDAFNASSVKEYIAIMQELKERVTK